MRRIQMSRRRPWRAEHPDAIVVARPTRWGNPFKVGGLVRDPGWNNSPACPYDGPLPEGDYDGFVIRRVQDRADAVALFREYVRFHDDEWPVEEIRRDLAGRDLACWCPLTDADGNPVPCHADVLLEICRG